MVYSGSGGPPPSQRKSSGGGGASAVAGGRKPYGFSLFEPLPSGKKHKVWTFRLAPGEKDRPFIFLDEALPDTAHHPSVHVHTGIKFNGTFGHMVICNRHRDEGCLMCVALQEPFKMMPWSKPEDEARVGQPTPRPGAWRWVATGLDVKGFTMKNGPLAGTQFSYARTMLLVPDAQYDDFLAYREDFAKEGGLRGKLFHVRRKDDKTSSKIGTHWKPVDSLTDEQLMEKCEQAAANYGLPVETYIRPYDYATVLKELSSAEMKIAAEWVAKERGVTLELGGVADTSSAVDSSTASSATNEEGDEDEVPF